MSGTAVISFTGASLRAVKLRPSPCFYNTAAAPCLRSLVPARHLLFVVSWQGLELGEPSVVVPSTYALNFYSYDRIRDHSLLRDHTASCTLLSQIILGLLFLACTMSLTFSLNLDIQLSFCQFCCLCPGVSDLPPGCVARGEGREGGDGAHGLRRQRALGQKLPPCLTEFMDLTK